MATPTGIRPTSVIVAMSALADLVGAVLTDGDLDDTSRRRLAAVYRITSELIAKHAPVTEGGGC